MASIRLFRVSGIDVKVHYSLFIVIAFLAYIFYIQEYPYGFRGSEYSAVMAIVAAVSLFLAVFLHELGHAVVSKRFGHNVREIILFIFGGLALIEKPARGMREAIISLSGPAVSVFIAVVFYILSGSSLKPLSEFSAVFYRINLIIAIFNLIPAFPLDGGRVLRGLLSEKIGYRKATYFSAEAGKAIAIFMGIAGLVYNLWLTFIAIFIYLGAAEELKYSRMEALLSRFRVRDIMTTELKTVPPDMTVREFIEFAFKHKHLGYPVMESGRLVGIITLHDVTGRNPEDRISQYMNRELITLSPDEPAMKAFEVMNSTGVGRIPIVENGELVGIITKTDLIRLMQIQEVLRLE
ncbi:M50 family metallopeptidase [Geoglobus acetivorans]|uniref:Zinc metalloprotease n=1 Tax=Geoglobus acetivorans TaxID=565033 RepID=A0ABZ3H5S2_GEOAI|nr:M50 family metallopeptidase [Geoglobus acetivorans]